MGLWLKAIHAVAGRLKVRNILAEDNAPYLDRHRIHGYMPGEESYEGTSYYLHRFHQPDLDSAPHNHPWKWAFSLVLAGGYTEERVREDSPPGLASTYLRRLRPGSFNILTQNTYHRVTQLHGEETWTLFVTGPRAQGWGFLVNGKHMKWKDRFRQRGIPVGDS